MTFAMKIVHACPFLTENGEFSHNMGFSNGHFGQFNTILTSLSVFLRYISNFNFFLKKSDFKTSKILRNTNFCI